MIIKYHVPSDLAKKINFFYKYKENHVLEFSYEFNMYSILNMLPINLKTRMLVFLFKDAIEIVPFL